MKKLLYTGAVILSTLSLSALTSCTKDFEELNTDPNKLEVVSPGALLTPTIYNMSTYFTVRSYSFTWQLMQVGLPNPSPANGVHRYEVNETAGNGTWNTCYRWLANIREMEYAADNYSLPVYRAVAATLRAYIAGILTDSFGDIPYSEALLAEDEITQPRFDTQEEVYNSLISGLIAANEIYASGPSPMNGDDLLYSNDMAKWRKFNNSLLMRLYLRLSKREEYRSYERIQEMIDQPDLFPVFSSNADAALVTINGVYPIDYAWGRRQDYVNFEAMSSFFVDMLNRLEDPRRSVFMTQASELRDNVIVPIGYRGIPSAHSGDESQFNFNPSTPNGDLMVHTTLGTEIIEVIMSYAEVEFIKAEVALKSGDAAQAKAAYEKGIAAGVTQWRNSVLPEGYVIRPELAFNGTMEQLMEQKYLALFMNDYQQWFEYRRTGLPELPKTEYMWHEGVMPTRFQYHNDVRRYNPENYQVAADRIGGDQVLTKVWWER